MTEATAPERALAAIAKALTQLGRDGEAHPRLSLNDESMARKEVYATTGTRLRVRAELGLSSA